MAQAGARQQNPAVEKLIHDWANKAENMKPLYVIEIDDVRYEVYDDGSVRYVDFEGITEIMFGVEL